MNFDFQKFLVEAASIDELLGPAYVEVTGQKQSTDRAAIRLAAWCRSAASGDWDVFFTRLRRDDLSVEGVLRRFADVRRLPNTPLPQCCWVILELNRGFYLRAIR